MATDTRTCPHCGQQTAIELPDPDVAVHRVTPYSPHSEYDAREVCPECNESLGVYFEVASSSSGA